MTSIEYCPARCSSQNRWRFVSATTDFAVCPATYRRSCHCGGTRSFLTLFAFLTATVATFRPGGLPVAPAAGSVIAVRRRMVCGTLLRHHVSCCTDGLR